MMKNYLSALFLICCLFVAAQGLNEKQKAAIKKRNIEFPALPISFGDFDVDASQGQSQSQSQSQVQIQHSSGSQAQFQWQSQSQSQSQGQTSSCDPACSHGECVDSKCVCTDGWSGLGCDEFECTNVCVHGVCAGPDQCDCNSGWQGETCETAVCTHKCLNGGVCSSPDTCTCKHGYEGEHCGSAICVQTCYNEGSCVSPNVCECAEGFEGTLCQIPIQSECRFPFEYDGNIYSTCIMVDSEFPWCSPDVSYSGNRIQCDFKSLCDTPGQVIEIPGECHHYYACNADSEIFITKCAEGSVFNAISGGCDSPDNTPQCQFKCSSECQNGGTCIADDQCLCPEGYAGNYCEFSLDIGSGDIIIEPKEHGRVCSLWGKENFYTFDGAFFANEGRCHYNLISDCTSKSFQVSLRFDAEGNSIVEVVAGEFVASLSNGKIFSGETEIPIPSRNIFRIPYTDYIVMISEEGSIAWNGKDSFFLTLHPKWAGKVCGLCGNFNGVTLDDLILPGDDTPSLNIGNLMNSWAIESSETCDTDSDVDSCSMLTPDQLKDVTEYCNQVTHSLNFTTCNVPLNLLEETCIRSLCECASGNYEGCVCDAVTQYSKICVATGADISEWRTHEFCEKKCPNNLVHMECGGSCPQTCKNKNQNLLCATQCVDGCFCPHGTVLDGDRCVLPEQCPCTHLDVHYDNGAVRESECESCQCNGGSWTCNELPCGGECAVVGDPHYKTFDGLNYQFMGQCQYVLSTDGCGDNAANFTFAIIAENVKCGVDEEGTCTKEATLVIRNQLSETKYQLKQEGVVSVAGVEVTLPYSHGNVAISRLSSLMIQLKSSNGVELEWDGAKRLYVKLQSQWRDSVCGMCGNFNSRSVDDLRTPQNLIETNVASFGNSWKVNKECADTSCTHKPIIPEACSMDETKHEIANEVCGVIRGVLFKECHKVVDWGTYYYNCRNDVCECAEGQECACDVVADYARTCVSHGVTVHWRNGTTCPLECGEGMEYRECGGDCVSTCQGITTACPAVCHPGCYCTEDLYLNGDSVCVEKSQCECYYEGEMYNAGEVLEKPGFTCTCANGEMNCEEIHEIETCTSPYVYLDCSTLPKGSTGVECLPTCQNSQTFCSSEKCVSGCACPPGMIKDEDINKCVEQSDCSCRFNGDIYKSGDVVQQDACNKCTCTGGTWACTEKACPAECSSVGDPHYKTFDGQEFTFQGDCTYTMSEDFCGNETSGNFRVIVENIPCGNNKVTCAKSVTVILYNRAIHLTKGEGEPVISESVITTPGFPEAPASLEYNFRQGSIYLIVETNIGLSVLWNKDNAAKVQLQPSYMGKVCGLCGNFDGNMENDFQMRGGDVTANVNEFGNEWKVIESCPDADDKPHPCEANPDRLEWATKKCDLINSEAFAPCHAVVNPDDYIRNCMYDTCGCDFGGDCDCFCTAVAVYAQECAQAGVCINWRNNEICPIMCEVYNPGFGTGVNETCEWRYEACGNPCPPTCDDKNPTDCPWKQVEGCYTTCKEDEVWDPVNMKCMKEADCPPPPPTTTTPFIETTTPTVTVPKDEVTTAVTTAKPTPPQPCQCIDNLGEAHWAGESWPLRGDESLCVTMTCVEEVAGVCKIESTDTEVRCTTENKPTCANGFPPVAVTDGCSCAWECQCYCFGQGDPHFFTFDGYYYPFQGNCTFVLSRDVNAYHSNHPHEYEIWMDNIPCPEAPDTTCTKKMTVRYDNTHVVLYRNYTYTVNGGALLAKESLPHEFGGVKVEMRGISLFYLTIAEIDLTLTYTGQDYSWSLSVPYSRYFNLTEGLCGLCNNDQSDDFTDRTGEVVDNIEDFGNEWLVFNESGRCFENITCTVPHAVECDIIKSPIFKECHEVLDPEAFYKICKFDTSRCGNYTYCEAVYGYARACQHHGVCVDWRSDDVCPIECPENRVYQACKPNCENECSDYLDGTPCENEEIVEGCFCPPNTVLENGECLQPEICTNCVDVDGSIYAYGDSWIPANETCGICSCMEHQQVICTSKPCGADWTDEVTTCSHCHVPELVRGSDPCCPEYHCVCNYELSKGSEHCDAVPYPLCDVGYAPVLENPHHCIPSYSCQCNTTRNPCPPKPTCGELEHVVTTEGDCCPIHTCECRQCVEDVFPCSNCEQQIISADYCGCLHSTCEAKEVCRFNGTDYQPGSSWGTSDPCESCTCTATYLNENNCYNHECYVMACDVFCSPCSEYRPIPGQCCGECVNTGCTFENDNGENECKDIGDNWVDIDICAQYHCVIDHTGDTHVVEHKVTCEFVQPPTCSTCFKLSTTVKDCCPSYECVPDDICCLEGPTIKVPGESWAPDTCHECTCTHHKNDSTGFHHVSCTKNDCPPFNEVECSKNGGQAVPTNDGCCWKCDNKCVDSMNQTYAFGEHWYSDNCTICSCTAGHEIVCNSVSCPKGHSSAIPSCSACEISVRQLTSDICCPQYDCVCNYELGQGEPNCDAVPIPKCPPGHIPHQTNVGECIPEYECTCNKSRNPCPEDPVCPPLQHIVTQETDCCPLKTCECRKCVDDTTTCSQCEQTVVSVDSCGCKHVSCVAMNICLMHTIPHQIGETWNPDVCTECTCTSNVDSATSCNIEQCIAYTCHTQCPSCHEYREIPGQCCGECVQTGCAITNDNGHTECKDLGESWNYKANCTEFICTIDMAVTGTAYTCPELVIPSCPACHRLEINQEECCPVAKCVQESVCCDNGIGKLPGTTWAPDSCQVCQCSDDKNENGFHVEECFPLPCPPFDSDACEANGGTVIATENGCCLKCQAADCYECSRRISTRNEYMVVDECASLEPVSMSYCDGFCRGGFFWSQHGSENHCSCCNPTASTNKVVSMKCKNGTEIDYTYPEVTACGCSATCTPDTTPAPEAPVTTTTLPPKPTPTTTTEEPEESGSGEITTPPEAPVTTTTLPPKPTPTTTTEEPEESGSGEITTPPEAPVTTTTLPPKPTPTTTTEEPEESGSGEITTPPEAPVTTTTLPPKPTPTTTTEEPEESGSGEITTPPEAPVTTTTLPPKPTPTTTTEEPEESGSGEITTPPEAPVTTTTLPPKPTPTTTTEEPEESGSGEITIPPEAPVTTTTLPPKPTPTTTTEEPEESGSGEITTPPEAPVTTTTLPPKPTPTTTTEEPEESGSGEITTPPEAPVTTTTLPPKPTPTTTQAPTTTTTEEPEESGSGDITIPPEAPVTTTTLPPKPTPTTTQAPTTTTTEEPEESGSGEITTPPEAPVTTTTLPPKPTPTTTTEEPEESGSGDITIPPEAPVTTTTLPPKPTPTTTTEEPEESGSGDITIPPEAPVTTTTLPPKPTPTTTTEEPEESGSGEITTPPEAPVTTTTLPPKPTPTTTQAPTTTTTEEPEESGSGDITIPPEAPVTTTTLPPKPTPTTTQAPTTTTTEEPEESGSGDFTTPPEAPVTTTTLPPKPTPTTTPIPTTTTTEEPEESGSGDITIPPEAPVTTTTPPPKPTPTTTQAPTTTTTEETTTTTLPPPPPPTTTNPPPTTTTTEEPEESGSGDITIPPEAPVTTTTTQKPIPTTTTTTTPAPTTTTPEPCYWSDWVSSDKPKLPYRDDNETFSHIIEHGSDICTSPEDIECRPVGGTVDDFASYQTWQVVSCDASQGLLCRGEDQTVHPVCENYEVRVYCCPAASSEIESDVKAIQEQVQSIIQGIEKGDTQPLNGETPEENFQGQFQQQISNVKSQDQLIDTGMQHLLDQIHTSLNDESGAQQANMQSQIQSQISDLNTELDEQSQSQEQVQAQLQSEISSLLESVNDGSDASQFEIPDGIEDQVKQVLSDISEHKEKQISVDQEQKQEIQGAIQSLMDSEANNDSDLQKLIHDTVDQMNTLKDNQDQLIDQEQLELQQLTGGNDDLAHAINLHLQQNDQASQDNLKTEIEDLLT